MTHDIKATVEELERLKSVYQSTGLFTDFTAFNDALLAACTGMIAELRRLWAKEARQDAIEEAARRYREALDVFNRQFVDRACPELAMAKQDSCNALFAALPPRPSGGEEPTRGGLVSPATPPPAWTTQCRQCDGTGYIDLGEVSGHCAACEGTGEQKMRKPSGGEEST